MIPTLKPDGTEGTAIRSLTVSETTHLQGCIVCSRDENLKCLIQPWKNASDDQNAFSMYKYIFYSPIIDEKFITKQLKMTIRYPKNGTRDHYKKEYELEGNLSAVVVDKFHLFLFCESKKLNECSFLKEHKINGIRLNQRLGKIIYGLGKYKDHSSFIKLEIKKCDDSSGNEYEVQNREDFEKLWDAGPILMDEHTLVGSFVKVKEESCRISCYMFETKDNTVNEVNKKKPPITGKPPIENMDCYDNVEPISSSTSDDSHFPDQSMRSMQGSLKLSQEVTEFKEEI
ncbi:uncharacterized protein LOC116292881, partial [Actinia tenebrosa]|uniref:Uncharacterized protein LOC116292881 n=1 Tax=Actinia tenebrosa TaxID=6105 RepID=A0A6P8HI79_ACTTE